MQVILLSLPWADQRYPSAGLGALSAFLKARRPDWNVICEHPFIEPLSWDPQAYVAISNMDFEGELIYASLIYQDYAGAVERIASYWETLPEDVLLGRYVRSSGKSALEILNELRPRLEAHIDRLVASRTWDGAVVGLTNSGAQLFANVLFAQRLKSVCSDVTVVFGGPTVSPPTIADSVLATYPSVDFVVHGEGELPLLALVDQIAAEGREAALASAEPPKGVGSRLRPAARAGQWQVQNIDELPTPDHDSFYRDKRFGVEAVVPIEGSRGCWWVRSDRDTCQFCNMNIQWNGYRQKSARRIAEEIAELSARYEHPRFAFVDNILRVKGFDAFVDELAALPIDLFFFYEARAHITPDMILRLVEIGLRGVQFGLEGLSTSFLRRIKKGTTTLMNLQVMKTCSELKIRSLSNLIVGFPGSTAEEVAETVAVIERFAFAYQPARVAGFELGIDSTVQLYPDEFHVSNLRNADRYGEVIPPGPMSTLRTYQLSCEHHRTADWKPVGNKVREWHDWYDNKRVRFEYLDGGAFLHILRRRPHQAQETINLSGDEAEIYRFCLRARQRSEIHRTLRQLSPQRIDEVLASLVDRDLTYQEGNRFLSLALAPDPYIAMRRIRRQASAAEPIEGERDNRVQLTVI